LAVSVTSPEGKTVRNLTSVSNSPIPVVFVATSPGYYRIELLDTSTKQRIIEPRCHSLRVRDTKADDASLIEAARLFLEGNNLAWKETADQLRNSEKTYAVSLRFVQSMDQSDPTVVDLLTRILLARGTVLNDLNSPSESRPFLQLAREMAHASGDKVTEAATLIQVVRCYLALGETGAAFEYAASALAIARGTNEPRSQANALKALADLSYEVNDYRQAREYARQALGWLAKLTDRRGYAHALITMGLIESDENHSEAATGFFTQVLSLSREIGYQGGSVDAVTYLGHLRAKEGQIQQAIELYAQAEETADRLGDKLKQSWITSGRAYVYDQIGDSSRALQYYQETLRLRLGTHNLPAEASIYRRLGAEYSALHDYSKGAYYLEKAILLYEGFKQWRYLAVSLRDLGQIAESQGDYIKATAYYARAGKAMEKADDERSSAYLLMANGRLQESLGSLDGAFDYYEQALKLHRNVNDPRGESEALFRMALVSMKRQQLSTARSEIEEALKIDESFRSNVAGPDFRASFVADVRTHYEAYIDLLMQLHKLTPVNDWAARALEANERGRARSLIETLREAHANIREGVDAKLIQQESSIEKDLSTKIDYQRGLLSRNHTEQQKRESTDEIHRLSDAYELIEARIRSNSPRYATLVHPPAIEAEDVRRLLDADTLLLEYSLGDKRSFLWLVTPDSIKGFELPGRKEIEDTAERLTKSLTERNRTVKDESPQQWRRRIDQAEAEYAETSAKLSKMVIEPIADLLGNKRLVIVADGSLQLISFGALPGAQGTGLATEASAKTVRSNAATSDRRSLIEDHEIVYQPSASVLALQRHEFANRKPAPHAVAVLANPVFNKDDDRVRAAIARTSDNRNAGAREDGAAARKATEENSKRKPDITRALDDLGFNRFPRLRSSQAEAEAIIKVAPKGETMAALNFDANRATAMSSALSKYRIVHFATHGIVDFEHPELSGIILSMVDEKGEAQDGYLRLPEIYNLNLPADLVVLSACQTGVGKQIKGEGLIALTRGFMYAGAPRVVASLWQVDDAATAELMAEFYKQMLINKLNPAAALRSAQLKLSHQTSRRSPYFWAGFVLQGEWK